MKKALDTLKICCKIGAGYHLQPQVVPLLLHPEVVANLILHIPNAWAIGTLLKQVEHELNVLRVSFGNIHIAVALVLNGFHGHVRRQRHAETPTGLIERQSFGNRHILAMRERKVAKFTNMKDLGHF